MEDLEKTDKRGGCVRPKMHYAWKIMIACMLLNMSSNGLTNTEGLFYAVMSEEMNIPMPRVMLITVCLGVVAAITASFVVKIYEKYPFRRVLLLSVLVFQGGYAAIGLFDSLIAWCICYVFAGIGTAFLLYVPVPMMISNWFVKKKKMILALCFTASGVGGIVLNLLLGRAIDAWGWRWPLLLRAVINLVMTAPVFFIAVKKPEDIGLRPYGADEAGKSAKTASGSRSSDPDFRRKLVFCMVCALMAQFICGMVGMLSKYALDIGETVVISSYFASMAMVGNIASKLLYGPVSEKYGGVAAGILVALSVACGNFVMGTSGGALPLMLVMSAFVGMAGCGNMLIAPSMADTFASGDDYVKVIARCSSATLISSAVYRFGASALIEAFGFKTTFIIYGCIGSALALLIAFVFGKKKKTVKG